MDLGAITVADPSHCFQSEALGRQTVQARQMLRKILADKIDLEPAGSRRQRGL